jgi:hypothetical protein
LAFVLGLAGCSEPEVRLPVHRRVALSPVFHIDQKFKSMLGPVSTGPITLSDGPREILWITSYRTRVVGPDGKSPASQEFLCHTNLDFPRLEHKRTFGWDRKVPSSRIFTTSQGQFEVLLPPGFGIPVLSDEPLQLNMQALNHNLEDPDIDVRHEMTVEYVRDVDARGHLEPLFLGFGMTMARLGADEGVFGVSDPTEEQEMASCEVGLHAPDATELSMIEDRDGRKFTQHWVVPPGREVRRTLATKTMNLPFDTTVHYIAVHLHPFAESVEMNDLTTGETIYKSYARQPSEGIGLAEVDFYSSTEGIPVYRDHDYEVVSVYENTSGENQDAMATLFLYMKDHGAHAGLEALRAQLAEPPPAASSEVPPAVSETGESVAAR